LLHEHRGTNELKVTAKLGFACNKKPFERKERTEMTLIQQKDLFQITSNNDTCIHQHAIRVLKEVYQDEKYTIFFKKRKY